MERGKVYYPNAASQLRDYSGLRYERNITPTDIDGVLDFGGKVFVFIELKYLGANFPYGQKLAMQNIVDAIQGNGKEAIFMLASHNNVFPEQIDGANAVLVMDYYRGVWCGKRGENWTLKKSIDIFRNFLKKI